jgi:DNA repair protein RecN (Recombination protein N)
MIDELSIKGLGVIDQAVLRWGPGLTVLTGETGAGKTMVLTALGLLLGGKADASLVRQGADRLEVEAVLTHVPAHVASRVEEAGGTLDGDALVLARVVGEQRARAFAGGRSVPAALLAELGEELIAVHGQSDQILLRRASAQRDALDRYLGAAHLALVDQHRATWAEHRSVQQQLAALSGGRAERDARREFLTRGLAEAKTAHPEPGEDERLRILIDRAQNVDAVRQAADEALRALTGDDAASGSALASGAVPAIGAARRALDAIAADATVAEFAERAAGIATEVDALTQDVSLFLSDLDVDPQALESALDRRGRLRELRRKWCDADPFADEGLAAVVDHADALIAWQRAAEGELAEADDATALEALRVREADLSSALRKAQTALTRRRAKGATTLAAAVSHEVQALGMPTTTLDVQVTAADAGPMGRDEVSFGLIAHEGAAAVPLHKGASGGELSRVMLGLEVVLAGNDPVGTYVFDEVDAGIGGEAALAVGQRLAQLGRTAQVLVVTHLAQVAAFADHHFVVTKGSTEGLTASDVRRVDHDERATELARMLAGMSQSERGRAHADELLQKAGEMLAGPSA